jgi:hypothetical protein
MRMARLTEEEAWALDDYVTCNDTELGYDGSGFLSLREARLKAYELGLNKTSIVWLEAKAKADHQSPAQIINALIHEKIGAASALSTDIFR